MPHQPIARHERALVLRAMETLDELFEETSPIPERLNSKAVGEVG